MLNTENSTIIYPPLVVFPYGTQPTPCPNEQVTSTLFPVNVHNQSPYAVFRCWLKEADHNVLLLKVTYVDTPTIVPIMQGHRNDYPCNKI